jgi:hypothetical protein
MRTQKQAKSISNKKEEKAEVGERLNYSMQGAAVLNLV